DSIEFLLHLAEKLLDLAGIGFAAHRAENGGRTRSHHGRDAHARHIANAHGISPYNERIWDRRFSTSAMTAASCMPVEAASCMPPFRPAKSSRRSDLDTPARASRASSLRSVIDVGLRS